MTDAKKSKTVKTPDEQIKEFGSVSLRKKGEAAIPSPDSLKKIAELEKDLEAKKARLEKETDKDIKSMLSELVQEKQYRLGIMKANLGNPVNLSTHERLLFITAAGRLLRHDRCTILSVVRFVLDNLEAFPLIGTKY